METNEIKQKLAALTTERFACQPDACTDAQLYHALLALTQQLAAGRPAPAGDRKSTRLNSSHVSISYAVFCLKKNKLPRYRRSWDNGYGYRRHQDQLFRAGADRRPRRYYM